MARLRSIKPEFWTSPQVIECSPNARLMFIGLWNFCDDYGHHPVKPMRIKAEVFPGDDFSSSNIQGWLDELSTNGLIVIYEVEGEQFLEVTGWHHQKIDRRGSPKYPRPVDDSSPNTRRALAPDRSGVEVGVERKGKKKIDDDQAYAWEGDVIRLNQRDFDDWVRAFSHLDLPAELIARDAYLSERDAEERKKWFQSTAAYFANRNAKAKVSGGKAPPGEMWGSQRLKEVF